MLDVEREGGNIKTLLLDAYNVIHKLPELSVKLQVSLRESRRALLNFMVDWRQMNGHKGQIYIVYDGQDEIVNTEGSKLWGIKCVFTGSKEEADDRLISIVRKSSNPSGIIVISEDGKVSNGCKIYGANVENPVFLKRKKKKKNSINEFGSKGVLSCSDKRAIDKYYKDALGF